MQSEFLLCGPNEVHLDTGFPNATVVWSDGSTQPTIDIQNGGTYWVEVHQDNCVLRDTIQVNHCCELKAPNVFTPNDDQWNNLFEITSGADIGRYNLEIYNRWGELIFKSTEISQSWDGKDGGKEVPSGVYYWYVTMMCIDNKKILDNTYKGTVSVIR